MTSQGKGVSGGIAIGRLAYLDRRRDILPQYSIEDSAAEMERFRNAYAQAVTQLQHLRQKALMRAGKEQSLIFEFHQLMLNDSKFQNVVTDIILNQHMNAEYAVNEAAQRLSAIFYALDDPYFKARASDVFDSARTLLDALMGKEPEEIEADAPVILAARELMPSDTLQLDKELLLGFVTSEGSTDSHTSILARTMGIPAVVRLPELLAEHDGELVIVDGMTGNVVFSPDQETLQRYQALQAEYRQYQELLRTQIGLENVTKDGRHIELMANIGSAEDLPAVLENDAGGIGLFRSEFIYLGRDSAPSEDEQFEAYKSAALAMKGKRVIIRTLDIGVDKTVDYFPMLPEDNPAMGNRAIRLCLNEPEVFMTQLRAIYRASAYGNIAVMFPMIVSLQEVRTIKELARQAQDSLRRKGIPFSENVELGIMIETPASALISEELAKEVDFFSVGTNDLIQYTLAVDRQNPRVESIYDPYHPAVLRLIRMAADAIHREGKWIGICGEMSADLKMTGEFLKMGINELSMAPAKVLEVRKHLRELDLNEEKEAVLTY